MVAAISDWLVMNVHEFITLTPTEAPSGPPKIPPRMEPTTVATIGSEACFDRSACLSVFVANQTKNLIQMLDTLDNECIRRCYVMLDRVQSFLMVVDLFLHITLQPVEH